MFADAIKEFIGVEPHIALMYLMCVTLGVIINWAKRSHATGISVWTYWTENPVRSQTAILATFSAFAFTLVTDPESSKLSYVAIGFAFDNLLSKSETAPEAMRYKQIAEAAEIKVQAIKEAGYEVG